LLEAIVRIGILLDFGPEFIERSAAAAGDTALELLADDDLSVNIAGVFMLSVLTEGPFDAESILAGLEMKQLETALAEIEAFYRRFLDAARSDPGSLPQKLGLSEEDTKSFMTSFVYAVPKVHQSMASALAMKSEQAGEPREVASLTAPSPGELPGLIDFKVFQLEARLNLSSIFSAQVSHLGEHNAFAASFEELAWSPLEDNRYAYLMGEAFLPDAGESMTREQAVEALQKLGIATGSSDKGFTAAALANFDMDAELDIWTVNDLRDIRQVSGD